MTEPTPTAHQRGQPRTDEVLGLFHGVVLRGFRVNGVIRHNHVVPRVDFDDVRSDRVPEDGRTNGTNVLECGFTLGASQRLKKLCAADWFILLQGYFAEVLLEVLIPDLFT